MAVAVKVKAAGESGRGRDALVSITGEEDGEEEEEEDVEEPPMY